MKSLVFATTNRTKFLIAKAVCDDFEINLANKRLDIVEIQAEDPAAIARDKAEKAFELLQQPVVVSDDSWSFAGLNGFPGAYMHSINEWFTPDDFLNLTRPLKNKHVTLTQILVYQDSARQKIFMAQTQGRLLSEARGHSKHSNHMVITLNGDGGLSIAEVYDSGRPHSDQAASKVWHDFAVWFDKNSG